MVVVLTCSAVFAKQFAVFPDGKELRSPDGKFVIRSVDYAPRPHEFSGLFHSLILQNTTEGSAASSTTTSVESASRGQETISSS
jgi:hypothetical protein